MSATGEPSIAQTRRRHRRASSWAADSRDSDIGHPDNRLTTPSLVRAAGRRLAAGQTGPQTARKARCIGPFRWWGQDSNLRRASARRFYRPLPLAARPPHLNSQRIIPCPFTRPQAACRSTGQTATPPPEILPASARRRGSVTQSVSTISAPHASATTALNSVP